MTLPITLVLLLASVGATVFFGWMGAKPRDYAKPPPPPWQVLMLFSAAIVLVMIVGVLNELGITTGANH
jgi:hypothetical protein